MAVLDLHFCARAFSSCGEWGPLFIAVRGPLTIAASLVGEHRLQMRRLSSCDTWAELLRGMWDPPRPGLEPVSPALAGRFSTTAPPGKPPSFFFEQLFSILLGIQYTQQGNGWVAWKMFSTVAALFDIPTRNPSTSSPTLVIFSLLKCIYLLVSEPASWLYLLGFTLLWGLAAAVFTLHWNLLGFYIFILTIQRLSCT